MGISSDHLFCSLQLLSVFGHMADSELMGAGLKSQAWRGTWIMRRSTNRIHVHTLRFFRYVLPGSLRLLYIKALLDHPSGDLHPRIESEFIQYARDIGFNCF